MIEALLEAGRSWVQFLMEPLDFSFNLILPAALRADAGNTVIRRILTLAPILLLREERLGTF